MITSYKDLSTACVPIMISNSPAGINPAKAIGKKIRESALSPIRVDTIARYEKFFPLEAIFILLIT